MTSKRARAAALRELLESRLGQGTAGRSTAVLLLGGIAAQALWLGGLPLLGRLYEPSSFGSFGLWSAALGPLSTIASLRYELAIVPAADDESAHTLVRLAALVAVSTAVIGISCVLVAAHGAGSVRGMDMSVLLLLPVASALVAVQASLTYLNNRLGQFRIMTAGRIATAAVGVALQILGGVFAPSPFAMTASYVMGLLAGIVVQARGAALTWETSAVNAAAFRKYWLAARSARDYPIRLAPAHLIGALATSVPIMAVNSSGGVAAAGLFVAGQRVLLGPAQLVAAALGDVYRQKAASGLRNLGGFRRVFIKTLKVALVLGTITGVVGYLAAPTLVALLMGPNWVGAIPIWRALAVAAGATLAFTPTDKGSILLGRFRFELIWHSSRLSAYLATWVLAVRFRFGAETTVWMIVLATSLAFATDAWLMWRWTPAEAGK